MRKDLCIVGAGPAGLLTTLHVKERDVTLIEEHQKIGIPKHCAGLVGLETKRIIEKELSPKLIDHEYNEIEFNILGVGKHAFYFKEPVVFHVKRPLLEWKLFDKVSSQIEFLSKVKAKPGETPTEIRSKNYEIKCQDVVASDGVLSLFRKRYFKAKPCYLIGFQGLFETSYINDKRIIVTYINHNDLLFHWIMPFDENLVLSGYMSRKTLPKSINEKLIALNGLKPKGVAELFGGLIPCSHPLKIPVSANHLFFFGDSIPLVKPYTGGGLYYIFKLAPELARTLDKNDPRVYVKAYLSQSYFKLKAEHFMTKFFSRTRYWLPVPILEFIERIGLFRRDDYDKHYKLLFKTLPFMPFLPSYLFWLRKMLA